MFGNPVQQDPRARIMTDRIGVDDFVQKLLEIVNNNELGASMKPKIDALIASFLARHNVITREEFDAQTAVLLRTREKLEQLESQLGELQSAIDSAAVDGKPE